MRWLGDRRRERREFLASLATFEDELERAQRQPSRPSAAWKGYRPFVVQHVVAEAADISSIYLTPEDRRALPAFLPGQFLTLRINVPGQNQPAVRCYSLSERPRPDYYRLTVKAIRLDAELQRAKGKVSRYLNRGVRAGDVLEAQAPRGDFHLHDDRRPAVLIAAGIGITPLLSMAATLLNHDNQRKVILFYGVRNSAEHAFRDCLSEWAAANKRLHYLPCYSQPLSADRSNRNVVLDRRVDVDLVRQTLPDPDFPCYVCGPGPFMDDMVAGLRQWGVAERDLHFEAFGPSTVKRSAAAATESQPAAIAASVRFEQSGVSAAWEGKSASLLELADAQGLNLPSGCRSGNCGMCATRLLAGQVRYAEPPAAPLDAGFCLTCVARPDSAELVLDA
jgi:ferredoxin-NADP reductase